MEFSIRPALPHEYPLGRMLLPSFFDQPQSSYLLLAFQEQPYRVVGAAAFIHNRHISSTPSFFFELTVIPDFRRQGIASSLIEEVITQTTVLGAGALYYHRRIDESATEQLLLATGFSCCREIVEYEINQAPVDNKFKVLLDAAADGGLISNDCVIEPLSVRHTSEARELFLRYLGQMQSIDATLLMVEGEVVIREDDYSLVLLSKGQVMGVLLATIKSSILYIEGIVVSEKLQMWGAYPLLLERIKEIGLQNNIQEARFSCDSNIVHIMKLARRLGASELGRVREYWMNLTDSSGE